VYLIRCIFLLFFLDKKATHVVRHRAHDICHRKLLVYSFIIFFLPFYQWSVNIIIKNIVVFVSWEKLHEGYSGYPPPVPESIEWFTDVRLFLGRTRLIIRSLPTSLPSPVRYARPATRRKTEKGRQLADLLTGEGELGGRGAKSYDPKKAKKGIDNQFC
jgi:hypothetical protein